MGDRLHRQLATFLLLHLLLLSLPIRGQKPLLLLLFWDVLELHQHEGTGKEGSKGRKRFSI